MHIRQQRRCSPATNCGCTALHRVHLTRHLLYFLTFLHLSIRIRLQSIAQILAHPTCFHLRIWSTPGAILLCCPLLRRPVHLTEHASQTQNNQSSGSHGRVSIEGRRRRRCNWSGRRSLRTVGDQVKIRVTVAITSAVET